MSLPEQQELIRTNWETLLAEAQAGGASEHAILATLSALLAEYLAAQPDRVAIEWSEDLEVRVDTIRVRSLRDGLNVTETANATASVEGADLRLECIGQTRTRADAEALPPETTVKLST